MPVTNVTANMELKTDQFKAKAKEIDQAISNLKKHIAQLSSSTALGDSIRKATAESTKALAQIDKAFDKTKQKVDELKKKYDELEKSLSRKEQETTKAVFDTDPTSDQQQIAEYMSQRALASGKTDAEAEAIYDNTIQQMREKEVGDRLAADKDYQKQAAEYREVADELAKQNELLDSQKKKREEIQASIDSTTEKIKEQNSAELEAAQKQMESLKTDKARNSLNERLSNDIAKAKEELQTQKEQKAQRSGGLQSFPLLFGQKPGGGNGAGSVGYDPLAGMLKGIKNIALAVLGVRSAWALVQKSISYVTSENKEMANTIKGMSTAMGAAFAPAIEAAVKGMAKLFNYFAAIWKALTGINIIAKANAKLAKDAADARGPAKFDEVDVLQDSSGGAGTDNLMKEIELNGRLKELTLGIKNLWEQIKGITNDWFKTIDFGPIKDAFNGFLDSLKPLLQGLGDFVLWIYQNVVLPFVGWLIEDAGPSIMNLLTAINDVLDPLFNEIIFPALEELWTLFLEPLVSAFGDDLILVIDTIADGLEVVADWLDENHEWLEKIAFVIGIVMVAIKLVTSPIGNMILLIGLVVAAIAGIIRNWDKLVAAVRTGVEKIKGFFRGLLNVIKSILNGIIFAFEWMINRVVDAFNFVLTPVRGISKITSAFTGAESLQKIGYVNLPRLARGAVIPPNNEFMAVLGDQTSGKNVEAPEGLIRSIVAEELAANNAEIVQLLRVIAAKNLSISKRQVGAAAVDYINDETERRGGMSPLALY